MTINKPLRLALKALSYGGIEIDSARHMANLKAIDPLKIFYKTIDDKIYNGDYQVPVRIYMPDEDILTGEGTKGNTCPVLIFIHGGGWVTESVENYNRVCARMAKSTGHVVVSIEYRLAPEHRFPIGLMDCYAVVKAVYQNRMILNVDPERITIIGDSAGGNLTAAICQMARDRKEFVPQRQILIYPAVSNDYSEKSAFLSVQENGTDFLLTAKKMSDYLDLYQSCDEDRQSPYFAPLLAQDFSSLPRTLVITAEFDPLRDEGEEYARKLIEAGNAVEVHRIKDALHGFFALGIMSYHVQESFEIINSFLKGV